MSIPYHPGKVNVVHDALTRLKLWRIAHVNKDKKESFANHFYNHPNIIAKKVHRLSWLLVCLLDSSERGVVMMNEAKSSLVSKVKDKQDKNPLLLELKVNGYKQNVMRFK